MLNLGLSGKIFLCSVAIDMRKGIDGLSGIVRGEFHSDPTDGSLFVFLNRRRDRLKILHFESGGFWLYYRVLEAGSFEELTPSDPTKPLILDATHNWPCCWPGFRWRVPRGGENGTTRFIRRDPRDGGTKSEQDLSHDAAKNVRFFYVMTAMNPCAMGVRS